MQDIKVSRWPISGRRCLKRMTARLGNALKFGPFIRIHLESDRHEYHLKLTKEQAKTLAAQIEKELHD